MLERSMDAPLGTAARVARAAAVVALGGLVLAACTAGSDGGKKDGPREPLAVKSRQEALDWMTQVLGHVRQTAGGQGNTGVPTYGYFACQGTKMAATEDPYTLSYGIRLDVPDDQRVEVVRKVRDALGGEGLRISDYEESLAGAPSAVPTASFRADHVGDRAVDHYTVLLESAKPGKGVSIAVSTPCLMPPSGATSPAPTTTA